MVRDLRYIIKRVIIGILIALGVIFFKNNVSFAATIPGTIKTTYVTKICNFVGNQGLVCVPGRNYVFTSPSISSGGYETQFPAINTTTNGILFTHYIRELTIDSPITINNNSITVDFYNMIRSNGSGTTCRFNMQRSLFPRFEDNTNFIYSSAWNNNNLKPYFAEYYDNTTQTWVPTDIGIWQDSNPCILHYNFYNIPNATVVGGVRYYWGIDSNYSGNFTTINNKKYPISDNWNYNENGSATNVITNQYTLFTDIRDSSPNFNTYYIPRNSVPNSRFISLTPVDNSNHHHYNTRSDRYSGSYQVNFSGMSLEDLQNIQNEIDNISQQQTIITSAVESALSGQDSDSGDVDTSDYVEDFDSDLNDFSSSAYGDKFSSLISSLFAYPFTKMQQQVNTDLVREQSLNSNICMKNMGQDTILGEYVPYEVQFWRDYKFKLPCPHTEIYTQLKYGDYAFYGNNFLGVSMGQNGATNNFASIWLLIQHGLVCYFLLINILEFYKYLIDSNKSEIEVLEL